VKNLLFAGMLVAAGCGVQSLQSMQVSAEQLQQAKAWFAAYGEAVNAAYMKQKYGTPNPNEAQHRTQFTVQQIQSGVGSRMEQERLGLPVKNYTVEDLFAGKIQF
jgi:hypothetical protein